MVRLGNGGLHWVLFQSSPNSHFLLVLLANLNIYLGSLDPVGVGLSLWVDLFTPDGVKAFHAFCPKAFEECLCSVLEGSVRRLTLLAKKLFLSSPTAVSSSHSSTIQLLTLRKRTHNLCQRTKDKDKKR
jgi:hypothetical protein